MDRPIIDELMQEIAARKKKMRAYYKFIEANKPVYETFGSLSDLLVRKAPTTSFAKDEIDFYEESVKIW